MEKRSFSRWLDSSKVAALVAAILSLCLMGMLLCQGMQKAQAAPTDWFSETEPCSISLTMNNDEAMPSDLTYNLYKVASAVPQSGYNGYSFQVSEDDPFYSVSVIDENGEEVLLSTLVEDLNSASTKSSDYAKVASIVAEVVATADPVIGFTGPEVDVLPGLYLLVAYSSNAFDAANPLVEKDGEYVSEAYTAGSVYTFTPQLIALPVKPTTDDGYDSTIASNTANAGDWIYDPIITLKPGITPLEGTLTINKIVDQLVLNTDNGNNAATFVFEINAYVNDPRNDPNQTPRYSNVVSMVIDGSTNINGEIPNQLIVSGIDAGLWVEVTEVYTGATYKVAGDRTQYAQVLAPDGATVTFQNSYENTGNHGGSVTNSYIHANDQWPREPQQNFDHADVG